jgi:hypothetical protein
MKPRPLKPATTPDTREPRTPVPSAVRAALFLYNGKEKVCGWVRKLNTGGMYLQSKARFPRETEVFIETMVWEDDTPRAFKVRGWVAYEDPRGMGIQFAPPDADTLACLRYLIGRFESATLPETA